jgi:hypothetical protein
MITSVRTFLTTQYLHQYLHVLSILTQYLHSRVNTYPILTQYLRQYLHRYLHTYTNTYVNTYTDTYILTPILTPILTGSSKTPCLYQPLHIYLLVHIRSHHMFSMVITRFISSHLIMLRTRFFVLHHHVSQFIIY